MVCQVSCLGFGGHLDTTFRGWSSTLAAMVRLVLSRLILIFASWAGSCSSSWD